MADEAKEHVLVVTYYFPPSGGSGVQRVLKFVKYLRCFGWQPVVLTVSDGDCPTRDESLSAEIPPVVSVYRTRMFEPYDVYCKLTGQGQQADTALDINTVPRSGGKRELAERLVALVRATWLVPDARMGWRRHAACEGLQIVRRHEIKAIDSS